MPARLISRLGTNFCSVFNITYFDVFNAAERLLACNEIIIASLALLRCHEGKDCNLYKWFLLSAFLALKDSILQDCCKACHLPG